MDRETSTNSVFVFIFGFVSGVLVSSFIFISPLVSVLIIFVGISILVGEKIWTGEIEKEILFLALAIVALGSGTLRYSIKDFHQPLIPDSQGIVISEPEQRDNSTRFVFEADNGEKVLVNTDLYSPVQYGDKVEIKGKLQKPGIIDDEDGGRPFDYGKYLAKDDIYNTMSFAKIKVLSSGHGNPVKHLLFRIKRSFISKTKEILAEPYSSLLSGLIISGKEAMPKDILEEVRRAGVIHIVVLSGYNITIIAEFMKTVFRSAKFSVVGVIFFVIMTGGQATVVRAAIMALTVILAKMVHRNFSAPRALLVAGFLMLVHNPKILVFDPSFQLSFLATCGLIFISPIMEKYLNKVPEKWGLRTIIATTLATQVTVLPLLVYSVGDFSLVSLPANILTLIVVPYTMLIGFLATLVAFVSTIIAWPISFAAHLLLSWILLVSNILGNLYFATIAVPNISIWIIILIYIILASLISFDIGYLKTFFENER
mgnify:CR=1 FL=1